MKTQPNKSISLTRTAMIAGIITISIVLLKVPVAGGRLVLHPGEIVIVTSAYVLGRRNAFFAAGIGSALADLIVGASIFAPASFLIHGMQAWLIGTFLDGKLGRKDLGAMSLGATVVVLGYGAVSWVLFDINTLWVSISVDLVQTILGMIGAMFLLRLMRKVCPSLLTTGE